MVAGTTNKHGKRAATPEQNRESQSLSALHLVKGTRADKRKGTRAKKSEM